MNTNAHRSCQRIQGRTRREGGTAPAGKWVTETEFGSSLTPCINQAPWKGLGGPALMPGAPISAATGKEELALSTRQELCPTQECFPIPGLGTGFTCPESNSSSGEQREPRLPLPRNSPCHANLGLNRKSCMDQRHS